MGDDRTLAVWRKSTYSSPQGGNCVEVRRGETTVDVRDSKNRGAGYLTASVPAWDALLDTARR